VAMKRSPKLSNAVTLILEQGIVAETAVFEAEHPSLAGMAQLHIIFYIPWQAKGQADDAACK
jgi:hypothetical protein